MNEIQWYQQNFTIKELEENVVFMYVLFDIFDFLHTYFLTNICTVKKQNR